MLSQGVRSKTDSLNWGFGGACVGAFLGLRQRKLHAVVLNAVALAAVGTACDYGSRTFDADHMQNFVDIKARTWKAFDDARQQKQQ